MTDCTDSWHKAKFPDRLIDHMLISFTISFGNVTTTAQMAHEPSNTRNPINPDTIVYSTEWTEWIPNLTGKWELDSTASNILFENKDDYTAFVMRFL